ncbi:MAG: hypothetical protein JWO91_344 [Acidobacteriaceae bacterium]|nr:hypothetical protein [Acidobacteriaceae bacterium]
MTCSTNLKLETSPRRRFSLAIAASALLVLGSTQLSFGQKSGQKTFSSAGAASNGLFQAVKNDDDQAVGAILGAGKDVTSTSDEIEDKLERERFSQKYEEMHRLVREADGRTVLYIGAENWPFPVPLVSKNGTWYFDSKTGIQEILFRRVGENEIAAIQVCQAFANAKKQQDTKVTTDDAARQYAQQLITASSTNNEGNAFDGYYFRIVKEDSPAGANGDGSNGKKAGGLVLVAYPAEYRLSGIMTFIVTQDGKVYEKDLGTNTTKLAPQMNQRKPDSGWHTAA